MFIRALVFVSIFTVGGVAWAGDKFKPGKYQTTSEMEMNGQKMPPHSETKCIDAKEGDVDEMIKKMQRDPSCTMENVKRSAGKISFDMVCKKDGGKGHGEMTYGSDKMDMTMTMSMKHPKMGDMTMNVHAHAERVGDCP